jgi:hypothetical protein
LFGYDPQFEISIFYDTYTNLCHRNRRRSKFNFLLNIKSFGDTASTP